MIESTAKEISEALLCSDCFQNIGLCLDAQQLGHRTSEACPHCGSTSGAKLDHRTVLKLAHRFFVVGSVYRTEFGGAPVIEFNHRLANELDHNPYHSNDADLISAAVGIGFFYYGPPLWRIGYVEPLEALAKPTTRGAIVDRVLAEFPQRILHPGETFYRLRKGVAAPSEPGEYDSPPDEFCGDGRLDGADQPILYGSADLEVCVHECRVTAEDVVYVATLKVTRVLRLLDLTAIIKEEVSSFESLDMAVHMTFLASSHAYPISRAIAAAAKVAGFDGVLFPSYFSLLRTGQPFIETAYGLSTRVFPGAAECEGAKVIANIALFDRPIADGRVAVSCINRLYVRQVSYDLGFGPVQP